MSGVRVTVDPELCMASGTCMSVAPALFDMGDAGTAVPLRPVVERSAKVDEAVSRCPTGAIDVTPVSTVVAVSGAMT
jgi:ferredoxin